MQLFHAVRRSLSHYSVQSLKPGTSVILHHQSGSNVVSSPPLVLAPALLPPESVHVQAKYKHHGMLFARSSAKKAKFPSLGLALLQTSIAEPQSSDLQTQAFSRQLYLDSLVYLLRGLPSDLTDQEALALRQAQDQAYELRPPVAADSKAQRISSLLHRMTTSAILFICLLLKLLLPYLRYFFTMAFRYERTYHLSNKAIFACVNAVEFLGKRGVHIASLALGNDFFVASVAYCVDGICGGLTEALGNSMEVLETSAEY